MAVGHELSWVETPNTSDGVGDHPDGSFVRPDGAFDVAVYFGTVRDVEAVEPDETLETAVAISEFIDKLVLAPDGTVGATNEGVGELDGTSEAPDKPTEEVL